MLLSAGTAYVPVPSSAQFTEDELDMPSSKAAKRLSSSRLDRKNKLAHAKAGLNAVSSALQMTPMPAIALCIPVVVSIIDAVDAVKSNEEACLQLAERATEIVYAITTGTAGRKDTITEDLDNGLQKLIGTLQGILEFSTRQKGRFWHKLWNSAGDADAIQQYNLELDNALVLFELKGQIAVQRKLEILHMLMEGKQVESLRNNLGDRSLDEEHTAPVLPPRPAIFYGREMQVEELVSRVTAADHNNSHCILGSGGIGKTTLALVVLHEDKVVETYGSNRYFIPCDAATSAQGLLSAIVSILQLSGDNLLQQIVKFFDKPHQRAIIVLDNFETPWLEAQAEVEDILNRLASIKPLTVMLTLRGAERPLGPSWSRPFLLPLPPLDPIAARLTFCAISDIPEEDPTIKELLKVLDNVPLAITLMATLAQFETPVALLERWDSEHTSMLTRGTEHRLSSLDISIKVSLDGPGMSSNPAAEDLLALLALLPDGVQDNKHLSDIASDIPKVASAGALLRQVSLAYTDGSRVLRVLAPIRSFIGMNYPPKREHLIGMLQYYKSLALLSAGIEGGSDGKAVVERLLPEVGNLQAVLEHAFQADIEDIPATIQAAIDCTDLFKYTGLGSPQLLVRAAEKAKQLGLTSLQADCIRCQAELHYSRSNRAHAIQLFEEAMAMYRDLDILPGQGRCTLMLGMAESSSSNYQKATAKIELALELFRRGQNVLGEADCLLRLAQNATWRQDYDTAAPRVQAALQIFKSQSHPRGEARCMWLIGVIAYERRTDFEATSKTLSDAAVLYRQLGDATGEANCFRTLGRLTFTRGKYDDAMLHLKKGVKLYRKVKWVYGEANCCEALGEIAMAKRNDEEAISCFEEAQVLYRELGNRDGQIFCIRSAGDIAFRHGDWIEAKLRYEQALEMSESKMGQARANLGLAKVLLAVGDVVHAEESLKEQLVFFSEDGNSARDEGRTLEALGDLMQRTSPSAASDYYKTAAEKFGRAHLILEQAEVLVKLGDITSGAQGEYLEALTLYQSIEDEERIALCSQKLGL